MLVSVTWHDVAVTAERLTFKRGSTSASVTWHDVAVTAKRLTFKRGSTSASALKEPNCASRRSR